MKLLKFIAVAVLAFGIGFMLNNYAYSETSNSLNIAVVDIQKIVQKYDKVEELKKQRKAKIEELQKFISDARAKVIAEQDADKKKKLEDKYNKELKDKKTAIDKEYQKQLEDINKKVTKAINNVAKAQNFELVLLKNSVLYGGKDISKDVLKELKE